MNIKKAFFALGAMVFSATVALFPQQAFATPHYIPVAPCYDWLPGSTQWATGNTPGDTHFFICDGSYVNHSGPSTPALAVRDQSWVQTTVVKQLLIDINADLFVWNSQDEYNNYAHTAPASRVPTGTILRGQTVRPLGPNHPTLAINIFERPSTNGTPWSSIELKRALNHEIGHAIDFNYNSRSQTSNYYNLLEQDFVDFDAFTGAINWSGLPGNCVSLVANSARLKCWFGIKPTDTTAYIRKEFFAEEYASAQPNSTIPPQAGNILRQMFCTGCMAPTNRVRSYTYVNTLAQTP